MPLIITHAGYGFSLVHVKIMLNMTWLQNFYQDTMTVDLQYLCIIPILRASHTCDKNNFNICLNDL